MRLVVDTSVLVGELLRASGRARLGDDRLELFLPERMWGECRVELPRRIAAFVRRRGLDRSIGDELTVACLGAVEANVVILDEAIYASLPAAVGPTFASNNWVLDGQHTVSGKPLLANDPHRVVGLPSLRYMVHLVAPGWNVIGAGEPALPGVALGHNENIAWGFTIFGLDQQDLYVEELDPADPHQYLSLIHI